MKKLLPALVLLSLAACEYPFGAEVTYTITAKNNSTSLMFVGVSEQYPDLSIPADSIYDFRPVVANTEIQLGSKVKWEKVIDATPADTISIIFISYDTVMKYGWQNVRDNYRVSKRYDVGAAYLEANNWAITYP